MNETILIDVKFDNFGKLEAFRELMPDRKIIDWKDVAQRPSDLSGVHYALGWKPDAGLFATLPDLKVMFSVGAGVDHMLGDKTLPDLPLVRFVDTKLTSRMSEWICLQCLYHLRQQPTYLAQQLRSEWRDHLQPDAAALRVGIMGMGVLGQDAARKLQMFGFQINCWSRSKKSIEGVTSFEENELDAFLAQTDILVGLLPYTPQTHGIFNKALFDKLPAQTPIGSPVFINAGRGKSQVEVDIIAALESGRLGGVSLDVFEQEPLPSDSPLWSCRGAMISPHVASVSDPYSVARHVAGQIERYEAGKNLQHLVDLNTGY